ncbi:hypothetical protein FMEAI12_3350009 [Parafrankia sp. Ea1.12]|nr:hypothetical protein FMEAI12_3350009 [Parafrankia sp. Ea1.12]
MSAAAASPPCHHPPEFAPGHSSDGPDHTASARHGTACLPARGFPHANAAGIPTTGPPDHRTRRASHRGVSTVNHRTDYY